MDVGCSEAQRTSTTEEFAWARWPTLANTLTSLLNDIVDVYMARIDKGRIPAVGVGEALAKCILGKK
jgi:hypothetical protein